MNWNPLKRLSLLKHKPELDSTTQNASEQLERLVTEFEAAENVTKALGQSVKRLLDQILCMGKFEVSLTSDISTSNVFNENESMHQILDEWNSMATVNNTIGDEYVIGLQKNLVEPLKQLKTAFAELRAQIRLHDAVQLDVIKFQRKVASYTDKDRTGANLVKLQENKQALAASQVEFAKQTQQLVNDLSKFLAGLEKLKPLLEGFIGAELAWVQACKRTLDQRPHLVAGAKHQSQSERLKSIDDKLSKLSSLGICGAETSK